MRGVTDLGQGAGDGDGGRGAGRLVGLLRQPVDLDVVAEASHGQQRLRVGAPAHQRRVVELDGGAHRPDVLHVELAHLAGQFVQTQ